MIAELLASLFFVAIASGGGIPLLREARDQAQRSLTNSTSHVDDAARHLEGPDGECGPSYGSCGGVRCCSRYNWCSTGDAYCGAGCQAAYGTCAPAVGIPLGCYGDAASRDLTTQLADMGMPDCVKACYTGGFKYAGSQYGFQCFCGNTYGRYGAVTTCTSACTMGGITGQCGGGYTNSVHELSTAAALSIPESVAVLGCFTDNPARDLPLQPNSSGSNSVTQCVDACRAAGKRFAGSQYGGQCFCGDNFRRYGVSSGCSSACQSGQKTGLFGGAYANTVYDLSPALPLPPAGSTPGPTAAPATTAPTTTAPTTYGGPWTTARPTTAAPSTARPVTYAPTAAVRTPTPGPTVLP